MHAIRLPEPVCRQTTYLRAIPSKVNSDYKRWLTKRRYILIQSI